MSVFTGHVLLHKKYPFSITFSNKLGGLCCVLMFMHILWDSGVFNLQAQELGSICLLWQTPSHTEGSLWCPGMGQKHRGQFWRRIGHWSIPCLWHIPLSGAKQGLRHGGGIATHPSGEVVEISAEVSAMSSWGHQESSRPPPPTLHNQQLCCSDWSIH